MRTPSSPKYFWQTPHAQKLFDEQIPEALRCLDEISKRLRNNNNNNNNSANNHTNGEAMRSTEIFLVRLEVLFTGSVTTVTPQEWSTWLEETKKLRTLRGRSMRRNSI